MKKLLAAIVACTLTAAMLAGCGSQGSDSSSADKDKDVNAQITQADDGEESNAGAQDGADDAGSGTQTDGEGAAQVKTVKEGVLTMATNATFPPYEYYEGNEIIGIDVDIADAIAKKLGLELKIEDMEFNSIIIAVTQGKADIGLAGMTVMEERLDAVNFSDSYATGIQAIIVAKDSDIQGVDDLKGKKIGVQLMTTGDIYATDDFGKENVEAYNKGADAVMALKQGKVDAVIIDNQPALAFVRETEGLKVLDTQYKVEDYAAALSKDNEGLLTAVNGALAELEQDGTLQSIIEKYIVTE
jgi:ABC-type amino acid transport/signal transduction systems, periplasmic component/domain